MISCKKRYTVEARRVFAPIGDKTIGACAEPFGIDPMIYFPVVDDDVAYGCGSEAGG